jgi:hypothetical protein
MLGWANVEEVKVINATLELHDLEENVTEGNCVVNGYTTYTCKKCDWVRVVEGTTAALGHIDENKDHKCDRNCGVEGSDALNMDKHVDEGFDHKCDYGCETPIGDHKDSATDTDHICDYCKSEEVLEECSDVAGDKDHKCDICGKDGITEHTYAPATCTVASTCTECGATTGVELGHVDVNKDHNCDNGCGKNDIGAHSDSATDNDHICDYCQSSEILEKCADKAGDKDHKCDICGKDGVTEHDYAPATCDAPSTCTECGATTGEALKHEWLSTKKYPIKPATCVEYATYYKECKHCGESSENVTGEHYQDIPSGYAEHDYTGEYPLDRDDVFVSAANCDNGSIYYVICDVCEKSSKGTKYQATWEAGDKLTHTDKTGDGDHFCDYCGDKLEDCTPGPSM